ncbi:MAG: phosphoglycerate dehydrogenase [Myxococcales bacterium]|nr:phosphoglycerate dehydrogenase [Myxococcales bacterium]
MSETSYPLHKIKVVLLENIHQDAVEAFEQAGFAVHHYTRALNGAELIEAAADAHIIGIRSKSHLKAEFFEAARRLWAVGCFCIGTNQVDLDAAAARGVPVFNAPFSNTRSVAELVIAEIVGLHRQLADRSTEMHGGRWVKSAAGAHEVRGRTLGIVGYGRIGSQVSVLAEAMGMRVIFHDVVDVLPLGNARRARNLEELLQESDVVTLHVPATPDTRRMIGAAELGHMRPGAFLLNNARGSVVDVDALAEAISSKRLAGAAVDVFPREPSSNEEPFESPLRGLPNVILTPHIGGSTIEAQRDIARGVSGKLIRLMNNGTTDTAVNFPEVQLPVLHPRHHRILHYHRNVPGVLGNLHSMIAREGVNIAAQHLQSNERYAYAILDIDPDHGDDLNEKLMAVPETIRVRTLW